MANPQPKTPKAYSCVRCFERKVKCDKQHPCAGCMRAKVECIFRIPAAPRRRTKKAHDESLVNRLRQYEDILKQNGIEVPQQSSPGGGSRSLAVSPGDADEDDGDDRETPPNPPHPGPFGVSGQLIVDQGRARFVENKLWSQLTGEFRQPAEALSESSDDEEEHTPADDAIDFLLGHAPSSLASPSHPSSQNIFKLWQIFLTNVNPMMKIVHQPTLQEAIVSASGNLEDVPKSLEALMFAIYGAATWSMTDAECRTTFGESQNALLHRYRTATRKALTRAKLLGTSDIVVLQAFAIFLLSTRKAYDARTMWTLSGVAQRIGQGMGLHHDGTRLGLPPFETEMRRRLCWQLNLLDFRSAELSGFGGFGEINWWDTDIPSNVNDADLWPGMKEPPQPQTRPTEMIGCLVRYEIGRFWTEKIAEKQKSSQYSAHLRTWIQTATSKERDEFVDELEARIEEKYLKYCDLSVPIQFMATIAGRIVCRSMRIMANFPPKSQRLDNLPEATRASVWKNCLALIEADNLLHTYHVLRRFKWHTDVYFQWHALIFVLGELIVQPVGDGKTAAWGQVEDVFRNHPDFLADSRKPVHVAIGRMAIRAWSAREKAQQQNLTDSILPTPRFIAELQKLNAAYEAKHSQAGNDLVTTTQKMNIQSQPQPQAPKSPAPYPNFTGSVAENTTASSAEYPSLSTTATTASSDPLYPTPLSHQSTMDDVNMDWSRWDSLLNDFDMGSMPNPTQISGMFGAPQMAYSSFMPQYAETPNVWSEQTMFFRSLENMNMGTGEGGMRHGQQHSGL